MKMGWLLLAALMFSSASSAVDVEAKIKRMMLSRSFGEQLFIELDSGQVTRTNCHTNTSWHYVLDVSDALGEKMYAALLAAQSTKQPVKFRGSDSCTLNATTETLKGIELK